MTLKLPNGESVEGFDPIMFLAIWTQYLKKGGKYIIEAGMGKPTYPLNENIVDTMIEYWEKQKKKTKEAYELLLQYLGSLEKEENEIDRDEIIKIGSALGYDHPQGNFEARELLAKAFTNWYGVEVQGDNVLFCVGGAGGLKIIFEALKKENPEGGKVITPFPYYTLYGTFDDDNKYNLYPIDVMKEKGYRLTAKALEKAIQDAYEAAKKDGKPPIAFLLCDPNNPLGTALTKEELQEIAEVLDKYPDIRVIVDEAYAEMRYTEQTSLFSVASSDLQKRMVILRSGTKGLSASNLRLAAMICLDEKFMSELLKRNIDSCGHATVCLQTAFAEALNKLNKKELSRLKKFYEKPLRYVEDRLEKMDAKLPDKLHKTDGTFYAICDFSDLIGLPIPEEAEKALGKKGNVETDEDIIYSLLFTDEVMVAPLSYYGLDAKLGYMRITCSGGDKDLKTLMDRLEQRLIFGRNFHHKNLLQELSDSLEQVKLIDSEKEKEFQKLLKDIVDKFDLSNAAELKQCNLAIKQLSLEIKSSCKNKQEETFKSLYQSSNNMLIFPTIKEEKQYTENDIKKMFEKNKSSLKTLFKEEVPCDFYRKFTNNYYKTKKKPLVKSF